MRDGDLIILLGAGCSVEAAIPASGDMIRRLEEKLQDSRWAEFRELYYFVKAALVYADCMKGKPYGNVDIERLVNTLGELEKNRECTLYPFIAAWNQRLLEVAGQDFGRVREFRQLIIAELRDWIVPKPNYSEAEYYNGFYRLRAELEFPLRIFSLNYDLCLENVSVGKSLETGFDPATSTWDGTRFESRETDAPAIYLYKMHGSINWYRDRNAGNLLKMAASPQPEPDLIFGTDYKMQYIDPYLFYAYEFRRCSLECKAILTIGYSFRDEHINGIIKQALRHDAKRVLIPVSNAPDCCISNLSPDPGCRTQCRPESANAKAFLESLTLDGVHALAGIAAESSVPF